MGGALNGDIVTFGGIDGEVLIHRTLPDFIEREFCNRPIYERDDTTLASSAKTKFMITNVLS